MLVSSEIMGLEGFSPLVPAPTVSTTRASSSLVLGASFVEGGASSFVATLSFSHCLASLSIDSSASSTWALIFSSSLGESSQGL